MDQHAVEIFPYPINNFPVALGVIGDDQNISHGAHYQGAKTPRSCFFDKRIEFKAKGSPPERKRFDHHRIRPRGCESIEQRSATDIPQILIDRHVTLANEIFERRITGSDRGKLNDPLESLAYLEADRLSSGNKRYLDALIR
ncbi:MAG: hypothetical protein JO358_04970 [Alphaproteobacteria bacterium]|nr:hypothetical protein [Alphaproteobacteria bacterium]